MTADLPRYPNDPADTRGRFLSGPHEGDRLLTADDLASLLNSTPGSVRALYQRGKMPPSQKIGARRMWWESDVSEWLDARRETTKGRSR